MTLVSILRNFKKAIRPKLSRRKEAIRKRAEVYKIEIRKQRQKIKAKICFFKKINKID